MTITMLNGHVALWTQKKAGFSIMAVLLVAVLAFLLGHYATSLAGGAAVADAVKKVNATLASRSDL